MYYAGQMGRILRTFGVRDDTPTLQEETAESMVSYVFVGQCSSIQCIFRYNKSHDKKKSQGDKVIVSTAACRIKMTETCPHCSSVLSWKKKRLED